jgi:hypothetical protein
MSKKQDLKQDLKQLEKEVSKVYYHITNGIISKPYTVSNDVIHVIEEQTNKLIAEETDALRERIAELESTNDANKKLEARAERAEAMVEKLIEAGDALDKEIETTEFSFYALSEEILRKRVGWEKAVAEWKEQQ